MFEKKKSKFYVVWKGITPGIYTTWADCKEQVDDFADAKYKSYESFAEAKAAYESGASKNIYKSKANTIVDKSIPKPTGKAWCVDAACSGNPGKMEYQGVELDSKHLMFHKGPFNYGTNNIGEFLAVVHALALCKKNNYDFPIYSDSLNAIIWVGKKKCGTKLAPSKMDPELYDLILRAEAWLKTNTYKNKVLKWVTEIWGEIPADFGRK